LFVPILAAAWALVACAGPAALPDRGGAGAGGPGTAAGETVDLAFTVSTLDGASFDGHSLAGKPAVLWFWAPWCPTCIGQAPDVGEAAREFDGKITFVGVAGLDSTQAMRDFVALPKVQHFVQLADEQGVVWQRFGVTTQSTYVLLDAAAHVVYRGYLDGADLRRRLAVLAH
jgi:thiol-disulfide isomerase/thioredoxin